MPSNPFVVLVGPSCAIDVLRAIKLGIKDVPDCTTKSVSRHRGTADISVFEPWPSPRPRVPRQPVSCMTVDTNLCVWTKGGKPEGMLQSLCQAAASQSVPVMLLPEVAREVKPPPPSGRNTTPSDPKRRAEHAYWQFVAQQSTAEIGERMLFLDVLTACGHQNGSADNAESEQNRTCIHLVGGERWTGDRAILLEHQELHRVMASRKPEAHKDTHQIVALTGDEELSVKLHMLGCGSVWISPPNNTRGQPAPASLEQANHLVASIVEAEKLKAEYAGEGDDAGRPGGPAHSETPELGHTTAPASANVGGSGCLGDTRGEVKIKSKNDQHGDNSDDNEQSELEEHRSRRARSGSEHDVVIQGGSGSAQPEPSRLCASTDRPGPPKAMGMLPIGGDREAGGQDNAADASHPFKAVEMPCVGGDGEAEGQSDDADASDLFNAMSVLQVGGDREAGGQGDAVDPASTSEQRTVENQPRASAERCALLPLSAERLRDHVARDETEVSGILGAATASGSASQPKVDEIQFDKIQINELQFDETQFNDNLLGEIQHETQLDGIQVGQNLLDTDQLDANATNSELHGSGAVAGKERDGRGKSVDEGKINED